MILGTGIDLCRVVRIRKSVRGLGDIWIDDLFTPEEREACEASGDPGLAFAQGFAVKEAVSKALGTGFADGLRPRQVAWRGPAAANRVDIHGPARDRLAALTPPGRAAEVRITLGGTASLVSCLAVIEAVPEPQPPP